MPKFILYTLIAIVVIIVIFVSLLFFPHISTRLAPVRYNAEYSAETNRAIISLVNQLMRIHYGQFDQSIAELIFSDELIAKMESEGRLMAMKEDTLPLRIVDRNYMQTLRRIAVNDNGDSLYHVRVRVYGGLLSRSDGRHEYRRIHSLTIMRNVDDTYVIIGIDYDR